MKSNQNIKIKKFSTFEELKSVEKKTLDIATSVERHNEFEKFIKSVSIKKVLKTSVNSTNRNGRKS